MRRGGALICVLALSACAFSSEQSLFSTAEAAYPIANNAQFRWREGAGPDAEVLTVTFQRRGDLYDVTERNHPDETLPGVLFVAVPETPENDYIIQWRSELDSEGRIYAFMWPAGETFHIFSNPSTFEDGEGPKPGDAFCERRAYGECMFESREAVLGYYRNVAYPALSAGNAPAQDYVELTPLGDAEVTREKSW